MLISEMKGRRDNNSGYIRLFGNIKLGHLFSKAQATVISNGTELEKIILSKTNNINDLDSFIDDATEAKISDGIYVCPKKIIAKSSYNIKDSQPDLLIFILTKKRICKIIELKDGDTFDTKKVSGEKDKLEHFNNEFAKKVPFATEIYICSFSQNDKEAFRVGLKGKFELDEIMTGKELCELLKIDYYEIDRERKANAKTNFEYFIDELLKIDEVRSLITKKLKVKS